MSVQRLSKCIASLLIMTLISACGSGVNRLEDDPASEPTRASQEIPTVEVPDFNSLVAEDSRAEILKLYDYVDPAHTIPEKPLAEAILFFHQNKSALKNISVISLIDFSKSSVQKRWHFLDMKSGKVWSVHVAHGKGSDPNHDGITDSFSNKFGSNASSLGFYMTAETYVGGHGLSLRLDGLSKTNSNARARAIVVHGASYVMDANVIQGRSWGCPAISMTNRDKVINLIKGGSLIYAFSKN